MVPDYSFLGFVLQVGVAGWIVVYSLTLLERTRPMQRIFGPIPDELWEDSTTVIGLELRALVDNYRRKQALEAYRREHYGGH